MKLSRSLRLVPALLLFPALFLSLLLATPRLRSAQAVHQDPSNVQWLKSFDGKNSFNLRTDPRFKPFLQHTFGNVDITFGNDDPRLNCPAGAWCRPGPEVIEEFLGVPGPIQVDDHRFVTASGCVPHFCAHRGMLWVDTHEDENGPTVVFVAVEGAVEPSLWLYSNRDFYDDPSSLPHNLLLNINRWVREPVKPVLRLNKATIMDTAGKRGKTVEPETLDIPRSRWKSGPTP